MFLLVEHRTSIAIAPTVCVCVLAIAININKSQEVVNGEFITIMHRELARKNCKLIVGAGLLFTGCLKFL